MNRTTKTVREEQGAVRGLREAVSVAGPDALTYLQGQLSQDVDRLAPGDTAWSLLLQPQGKISAWVRVTRVDHEEFVLDVDHGWAEVVIGRLQRFKLRTDCTIVLAPWHSLTIVGPGALEVEVDGVEFEVLGRWSGLLTRDVFGAKLDVADDQLVAPEVLEAVRIEAGVPRMGAELDESTIPAAAGIVDQSVSFTKGCYTGQELVARIDSRGNNVPRRLVGVVLDGARPAELAAQLIAAGSEKPVGAVTSSAFSAVVDRAICLAYATRAVEIGDRVDVAGVAGQVVDLPLVKA